MMLAAHATPPSALLPPPVGGPLPKRGASDPAAPREVVDSVGGEASPLLANIYLHYALDLWVQQWRKRHARGEMYIVRYADDFVMGFQNEQDAHAMREALATRIAEFGLELHPEKTRVLRFGRFAREKCEREGHKRPQTFEFLGFTHIAGQDRRGAFQLKRRTSRKKRKAKLDGLRNELRRHRHEPVPVQFAWL